MKKTISVIMFLILIMTFVFNGNVYAYDGEEAAQSDLEVDMNVEVDKNKVEPGENVTLTVTFGEALGTYTVKVAYDKNIFEYVSASGGSANDTTDKVNVVFHDETGGTNPRNNMSVTFKAKESITTSNPTELTVTAEGLANSDASEVYEDILVPVVKNITVEPQYEDYKIKLDRPESIIKGKSTDMKITYSSSMGHYYEHARLVAEVTTPQGGNAKLLATDGENLEHDIVQSGWGDPQGYKIGGKDIAQILNVKGIFSEVGSYTITLSLIDRDNSDKAIASSTFLINVIDEDVTPIEPTTPLPQEPVGAINNVSNQNAVSNTANTTATPAKLPKTGINMYIPVGVVIIVLMAVYIYHNKKENYK